MVVLVNQTKTIKHIAFPTIDDKLLSSPPSILHILYIVEFITIDAKITLHIYESMPPNRPPVGLVFLVPRVGSNLLITSYFHIGLAQLHNCKLRELPK